MTSYWVASPDNSIAEDLTDDDAWGSDFDESTEELYSQEIEDNIINENLEAQQRKASNKHPQVKSIHRVKQIPISQATAEVANCNVSAISTGAIPKRGFSYLSNTNFIQQGSLVNHTVLKKAGKPELKDKRIEGLNEATAITSSNSSTPHFLTRDLILKGNLKNHAAVQRRVKAEPKDKNIDALKATKSRIAENLSESHVVNKNPSNLNNNEDSQKIVQPELKGRSIKSLTENRNRTAVIPTDSSVTPPNNVKVDKNTSSPSEMKSSPGKLRPEAFNFLNRFEDVKEERKHLVPTAFIHVGNLHHSQLKPETMSMSHDSEIVFPEPSAPLYSDGENYESIEENSQTESEQFVISQDETSSSSSNYNEETKPALPSRPPPIFKHLPSTSKSPGNKLTTTSRLAHSGLKLSVSLIDIKDDTLYQETSPSANTRTADTNKRNQIKSLPNTLHPNLIIRPLPPVPVCDTKNPTFQPKVRPVSSHTPELISRPLPPPPVCDAKNPTFQPKVSPVSPLTPELISRPLPPPPVSDVRNPTLQSKVIPSSPLVHELISRPLPSPPVSDVKKPALRPKALKPTLKPKPVPATPSSHQSNVPNIVIGMAVDQSSTSNEKSSSDINISSTKSLHPVDTISEIDKPISPNRNVTNGQSLNETATPSTQQRLSQIIRNQTQVSSEILQSQKRISSDISSRISYLMMDTDSETDVSTVSSANSLQNLSYDMDDEDYLQSITKSPSIEIEKPMIPHRRISNPHMKESLLSSSSSPDNENVNPPPYTDIETLHSSISRPCLPQKLKTTQRSMSCSSLVQSFKDLSFAMWIPPAKEKRISAGASCLDSSPKQFRKDSTDKLISKGVSFPNADTLNQATPPKPIKSIPDSSEKSALTRNAWYHDIDAREAQKRLLNFIDQNGAFLIRPSSRKTTEIQHTACIVFSGRIINMHIRRKPNGQFALGTEKEGEQTFSSISELIKYHQEIPIESSGGQSSVKSFSACLRVTPPKP